MQDLLYAYILLSEYIGFLVENALECTILSVRFQNLHGAGRRMTTWPNLPLAEISSWENPVYDMHINGSMGQNKTYGTYIGLYIYVHL